MSIPRGHLEPHYQRQAVCYGGHRRGERAHYSIMHQPEQEVKGGCTTSAREGVYGYHVTQVHSDQGTEFAGEFKAKCTALQVEQTYSEPYSPWQNGRAERARGKRSTRSCTVCSGTQN